MLTVNVFGEMSLQTTPVVVGEIVNVGTCVFVKGYSQLSSSTLLSVTDLIKILLPFTWISLSEMLIGICP